jgi:hypothetical protein
MPRIQLRLYVDPGQAEVVFNVRRNDDTYERLVGVIDTGAAVSLLPNDLLDKVATRLAGSGTIIIDQAGIAGQSFEATEAYVTVFLEDQTGTRTAEFEVRVWFADTDEVLIGFEGILDQAILHINMRDAHNGWIEIDP